MLRRIESLSAQQPLVTHQANGLELSLFPWEDAAAYVADIEAMLEETYAKPWLADEDLDLMTPDMDAIVNDPMFDRYLAESRQDFGASAQSNARLAAAEPVEAVCNWSFLEPDGEPVEPTGGLEEEPGYLESTMPWAF